MKGSGQPLRVAAPLRKIAFFNVGMCLDRISGERCTAMGTDPRRDFIRLPDILCASRRALFPGLVAAGSHNTLHPLILRLFLDRKKVIDHRLGLIICRWAGNLFHVNFFCHSGFIFTSKLCIKDQGIRCHGDNEIILILYKLVEVFIGFSQSCLSCLIPVLPFPLLTQADQKLLTAGQAFV